MKKGILTLSIPKDNSPCISTVDLITGDNGEYFKFLMNYITPSLKLSDEDGNDITDQIKNLNTFEYRWVGNLNGNELADTDPTDCGCECFDYDTDEENRAVEIERKKTLEKSLACDLSHLICKPMAEAWSKLAKNEINGGQLLHTLFAACVDDSGDSMIYNDIHRHSHFRGI